MEVLKKIGLYCSTIFHYYIYENIVKNLPNDYCFVSPNLESMENGFELKNFIEQKGHDLVVEDRIIIGEVSIDILLSLYWKPTFEIYPNEVKMVRTMYGYAKDEWNYADWNENYDLIFSYGLYAQQKLEKFSNNIPVGNPRIVALGSRSSKDMIRDTQCRLLSEFTQSEKETILYAPTWGERNSFSSLYPFLSQLSERYHVILKAHHLLSVDTYKDLLDLTNEFNIFYCDEKVDLFSLIPNADLLISDYSGAIFDGILCGLPTVLVNSQSHCQDEEQTHLEGIMRQHLKTLRTSSFSSLNQDIYQVMNDDGYRKTISTLQQELYANLGSPEEILDQIQNALVTLKYSSLRKMEINKRNKIFHLLKVINKGIVICGCGEYGLSFSSLCENIGKKASFLIDNFKEQSSINGIPVLKEKDFLQLSNKEAKKYYYFIATKSGTSYFQDLLRHKDLRDEVDFLLL